MEKNQITLNIQDIVKAFQALANPINSKQIIRSADQYILQCEAYPEFCLLLMSIFTQAQNIQTKRQILIHLKNVIKRNWTSKRRSGSTCIITGPIKEEIKAKLLEIYKHNWKAFYKDFNEIFKYLARQDFPNNYPSLNQFVKEVLTYLAGYNMEKVLRSEELLPYLSLVKVVYKEYAQRRMLHTVDSYGQFCKPTIELSKVILLRINEIIQMIKSDPQMSIDYTQVVKLMECSRKVDKIVLYCLQSMVSALQYEQEIIEVLKFELSKVKQLMAITQPELRQQIELNILAIIQLMTKLQSFFPLLFTQFLSEYLYLIIELLFSSQFENERLINTLILANMAPFTAFPYYMNQNQFRESLEYKRDANEALHLKSQEECHRIFLTIYSSANVVALLGKIVGQLMVKYHRENQDDEIIFQDAQQGGEGTNEQTTFELLVNFLKTIMGRFKLEANSFVNQITNSILGMPNQNPLPKATTNMYQIVLLLPKTLNENEINMTSIFNLMEKTFASQNFDMFCRLIRNFHEQFDSQTIVKSFEILISIITNPAIGHHTVYQGSVCIRKILVDYEHLALPLEKVGQCIARIFSLIQIYITNPAHLWNLLNLLIQILKALTTETIILNLNHINQCINILVERKNNDNMIICALAELLQSLLGMIDGEDGTNVESKMVLCHIAMKLVCSEDSKQEEELTEMSKHWVWLCVMKNIKASTCPEELKQKLIQMLEVFKEKVIHEDASLFFELLQQYLLSGILQINSETLLTFYSTMVAQIEPQNEIRTILAFFSLCYTYCLMTNDLNIKIALICIQKLKEVYSKVSPSINGLRTLVMMIISYFILGIGGQTVFGSFNQLYPDYRQWFWPYVWSLDYVNNKYVSKVTTMAILKSFNCLKDVLIMKIEENLPFDKVINFITMYTEPLKAEQAMNNYLSSIKQFSHLEEIKSKNKTYTLNKNPTRKVRLHVNTSWCQLDLTQLYRAHLTELFKQWDWGVDDLEERYTKSTIEKIMVLLNDKAQ